MYQQNACPDNINHLPSRHKCMKTAVTQYMTLQAAKAWKFSNLQSEGWCTIENPHFTHNFDLPVTGGF